MGDSDNGEVTNYEAELRRRHVRLRRALTSAGVLAWLTALVLPQFVPVESITSVLAIGGVLCFIAAGRVGSAASAD